VPAVAEIVLAVFAARYDCKGARKITCAFSASNGDLGSISALITRAGTLDIYDIGDFDRGLSF
jgi:hypothetical protein